MLEATLLFDTVYNHIGLHRRISQQALLANTKLYWAASLAVETHSWRNGLCMQRHKQSCPPTHNNFNKLSYSRGIARRAM